MHISRSPRAVCVEEGECQEEKATVSEAYNQEQQGNIMIRLPQSIHRWVVLCGVCCSRRVA